LAGSQGGIADEDWQAHSTGDAAIVMAARRLVACTRIAAAIIFRIGLRICPCRGGSEVASCWRLAGSSLPSMFSPVPS
jgi:uncharacterized membrane protein